MHQARPVTTNQNGPHEDTEAVVRRHLKSDFLKPIQAHNQQAFDEINEQVKSWGGPVILDSCCGVGESTAQLAELHPRAMVIGVDKSAHRVERHSHYQTSDNGQRYWVVRADLNDFWRLATRASWQLQKHCIFYPNPWPKSAHLARRWHGSPVWKEVVVLGGELQLRSNWSLYLLEVAQALKVSGHHADISLLADEAEPITPFERKYKNSGQALWQLHANLSKEA
ncbi:tRNA (guanine(46)-N(7))-methyltransferase TrmB [Idiomarina aminovorans]|uniref:tRNA (guanine(46)-N(7))-methyltransferase TrmB n=1 Tax=Idiomarina aminovorans TaxID=2914829 RepID=UPI0020046091|nr:tRNA (guanine-N(7)-)-methyltransferase [Idiomarina sp. ATCH4]MCK7459639.1 tRNA (guanine-N(7)-)-methyltransferase [Idiomarina sp. ATCH4]